jgi:hypothetical protein
MSAEHAGGGPAGPGDQPSEEELRAAYEAEIKRIRVEHIVLEQVVSLINLGMRRTGLAPGTEDERDIGQVKVAIDAVRALLPLIEESAGPQAAAIRDALSQLQLAFVKLGGSPGPGAPAPSAPGPGPGAPGSPGSGAPGPGAPGGPLQGAPPPPGTAPASPPGTAPAPSPGTAPGPLPGTAPPPDPEEPKPGEPGPAQRSGRLWIPGQ